MCALNLRTSGRLNVLPEKGLSSPNLTELHKLGKFVIVNELSSAFFYTRK